MGFAQFAPQSASGMCSTTCKKWDIAWFLSAPAEIFGRKGIGSKIGLMLLTFSRSEW